MPKTLSNHVILNCTSVIADDPCRSGDIVLDEGVLLSSIGGDKISPCHRFYRASTVLSMFAMFSQPYLLIRPFFAELRHPGCYYPFAVRRQYDYAGLTLKRRHS